ncbi:MAG TPA: RNA polymerase sigma-70 factor [Chitinophagaceae bacterium]
MDPYTLYTDNDLVTLLAQDDQLAFEQLYTRHWAPLYQSAFYIVQDSDACKDIIQDVFAWLWEHRHTLEVQSVKAYLKAAVRFKLANYIRSGRVRASFFESLAGFAPPALSPGCEELAEARELQVLIQQTIAQLPQKCQEIFRLSREERLTNQEIAERLGLSVKTVENQMTIALRRLRNGVEPYVIGTLLLVVFGR